MTKGYATHYEGSRDALRRSEVGVVFLVEGVAQRATVTFFVMFVVVAVVVLAEDGEQRYA